MTAPFAVRAARVQSAVIRHLANAEAVIGFETVPGVFREPYAEAMGMGGTRPVFRCLASALAALAAAIETGAALSINDCDYRVAEVRREEGGIVALILEEI